MKKFALLFLLSIIFLGLKPVMAAGEKIEVIIFTQTGCQYCVKTMEHLNALKKDKYPELSITEYDIRRDPTYYQLFNDFRHAYGSNADGTPVTFIGKKVFQGELLTDIDAAIEQCKQQPCENPTDIVAKYIKENPTKEQQAAKDRTIVGWVIIGVVIAGGGILLLSKN